MCKLEYAQTEIFIMNNFKDYISEDELTLVGFHVSWCEECKKTMRETIPEFKKLTDLIGSCDEFELDFRQNVQPGNGKLIYTRIKKIAGAQDDAL